MNWTAEHSPFNANLWKAFSTELFCPHSWWFHVVLLNDCIWHANRVPDPVLRGQPCRSWINNVCIVFGFSWGHFNSQAKLKTMVMQNFGGQTKSIMVCYGTFCRGSSGQFSATSFPGLFGSRFYPKAVTLIIQPLFISVWQVKKPYLREDSPVL